MRRDITAPHVALTFGLRLAAGGLALFGQFALAAVLGVSDYGRFSTALALVTVLTALSRRGLDQVLLRRIGSFRPATAWALLRRAMSSTVWFALGVAVAISLMLVAVPIDLVGDSGALVVLLMSTVPMSAIEMIAEGLKGRWMPNLAVSIATLGPALVLVAVVPGTYVVGSELAQVALLYTAGACLVAVAGAMVARQRIRADDDDEEGEAVPDLRGSTALVSLAVVSLLMTRLPLFLLGIFELPQAAGLYAVANRLPSVANLVLAAVSANVAAPLAKAIRGSDIAAARRLYLRTVRLGTVAGLGLLIVLTLGGRYVFALLGGDFDAAFVPQTILVLGQVVNLAIGTAGLALILAGRETSLLRFVIGGVLAGALLMIVLLLSGVSGAVSASFAASTSVVVTNGFALSEVRGRVLREARG